MTACADIAAVLLAAGTGSRFGGNKLEAMLDGTLLGIHAARTLAGMGFGRTFAVHNPAHADLAQALGGLGFALVRNNVPEQGLAYSLALATAAAWASEAQAMLVMLADMPFVTAEHLASLVATHQRQPDVVIASQIDAVRMPPAVFPRSMWPALLVGSGDRGARHLLDNAVTCAGEVAQFIDIDTRADLARALTNCDESMRLSFESAPILW